MVAACRDEWQRHRNGLIGLNGLKRRVFHGQLAVAANLSSKAVRCGASQKKTPRDSTKTYSPRGLTFWDVPQITAFHDKFDVSINSSP